MTAVAPPVVVTLPAALGDIEVLVRHDDEIGVEVDIRPAGSRQSWTPIALMGGGFVVRRG